MGNTLGTCGGEYMCAKPDSLGGGYSIDNTCPGPQIAIMLSPALAAYSDWLQLSNNLQCNPKS